LEESTVRKRNNSKELENENGTFEKETFYSKEDIGSVQDRTPKRVRKGGAKKF